MSSFHVDYSAYDGYGVKWLLIGPPGSGKTSLLANLPGSLFVVTAQDTGVMDLVRNGVVPEVYVAEPVSMFSELIDFNDRLIQEQPDEYLTLCYEGLTSLDPLCMRYTSDMDFDGDMTRRKFFNYQAGPRAADGKYWTQLIDQWESLQSLGYNVVVTGHLKVEDIPNPDGDDFIGYGVDCYARFFNRTNAAFDTVLFYLPQPQVTSDGDYAKGKAKATDRVVLTHLRANVPAKNRYGVDWDIAIPDDPSGAAGVAAICEAFGLDPETLRRLEE